MYLSWSYYRSNILWSIHQSLHICCSIRHQRIFHSNQNWGPVTVKFKQLSASASARTHLYLSPQIRSTINMLEPITPSHLSSWDFMGIVLNINSTDDLVIILRCSIINRPHRDFHPNPHPSEAFLPLYIRDGESYEDSDCRKDKDEDNDNDKNWKSPLMCHT